MVAGTAAMTTVVSGATGATAAKSLVESPVVGTASFSSESLIALEPATLASVESSVLMPAVVQSVDRDVLLPIVAEPVEQNVLLSAGVELEPIGSAVSRSASMPMPEPIQLAQVTNVSELSDVQPGDWAFTALQRLVEEYGCLEGYPDRTYRGNRALTRYEFAAGLNACLDVVIQLIDGSELAAIRRLQEEFAAELATIRGRVDGIEADVAELQANQFSTTTRLNGYLDAHLVVPFGDSTAPGGAPRNEADATFEYWSRLNFVTSFTGEDELLLSVAATDNAGSLANSEFGLNYTQATVGGIRDNVGIDDAYYSFPVGNRINAKVAVNSLLAEDFVSSLIVPFGDYAVAAAGLPEFYFLHNGGDFGAGANVDISDNLVLDLAYMSAGSNVNQATQGLFNNNTYMAQLNLLTDGIVDAAVVYLDGDQTAVGTPEYTLAGLVSLDFGKFIVGGHYAHSPANGGTNNLDSYMGGVSFPNMFGSDNELGIYGGVSPNATRDPLLFEAYYKMQLNDFFTLTPAVVYTDNDGGSANDDSVYGALRASFSF